MKIDILCNDGSPMGVVWEDIYGKGVGGAELALLSLAETLSLKGHKVTIFNNPRQACAAHGIRFANLAQFEKEDHNRDILLIYRSPNILAEGAIAKRTIWWSTDQFTVGDFTELITTVDFCVTISPFHTEHHMTRYSVPLEKIGHINLGVRDDYQAKVEKIPNKLIFCSVPDRGLPELFQIWTRLYDLIPNMSLVITSDYRLWGVNDPSNQQHRMQWMGKEGVLFAGKISRKELVRHQQEAQIMAYPCTYNELFCISAAECQVAGAYPVTSSRGSLPTTNRFGTQINGNPGSPQFGQAFIEDVERLLVTDPQFLKDKQERMMKIAPKMFSWDTIAEKWLKLFETGEL